MEQFIRIEKTPAEAVVLTAKAIAEILNHLENLKRTAQTYANKEESFYHDWAIQSHIVHTILKTACNYYSAKHDWADVSIGDEPVVYTFKKEQEEAVTNE